MNLCPKCGDPRVYCERRAGERCGLTGWWKCRRCTRENDRARRRHIAVERVAAGRGSNYDNRRNECICASGGADICPVHRTGEVERRILAANDFWRVFGC